MIELLINSQPDDETCGPTSLHAIYRYYGLDIDLNKVINSVERSYYGGTLAPMLGKDALLRGFKVTTYINNLNIFDLSWFDLEYGAAHPELLKIKLNAQLKYKKTKTMRQMSRAYLEYLELGGELRFRMVNTQLLKYYFQRNIPILTGLSATYLYGSARERYIKRQAIDDDIRGVPCGHFVILCGYDTKKRLVVVADPHRKNPLSQDNYYKVGIHRLINAIMVGVLTYDANLIIIQPKSANGNINSNG